GGGDAGRETRAEAATLDATGDGDFSSERGDVRAAAERLGKRRRALAARNRRTGSGRQLHERRRATRGGQERRNHEERPRWHGCRPPTALRTTLSVSKGRPSRGHFLPGFCLAARIFLSISE